jgi:FkbM family methyltransferase
MSDNAEATPDNAYEIHIHHIGGFAGELPLPIPASLRRDICLYLYDANAAALDHMGVSANDEYRRKVLIGKAVFDREGDVDVSLTYTPASASLLPVSPDFLNYWRESFVESDMCDVLLTEQLEVGKVKVACTTIDTLIGRGEVAADILLIDAEGVEGPILDGAAAALGSSIVGLICEIHFAQYRTGQTSVGELFGKAEQQGFHLADMRMHPGRSFSRVPIGWRTGGCSMSADALFYKRIDAIRASYPAASVSLLKLGLFALLTRRLEQCVAAVEAALALDPQVFVRGADFAYVALLDEMSRLYRAEAGILLPTWTDFYPTYEAGLTHGDPGRGVNIGETRRRYFAKVGGVGTFMRRLAQLANSGSTPLEALLSRHGLDDTANQAKAQRLFSIHNLLRWLDLAEGDKPTTPETIARKIAQSLS